MKKLAFALTVVGGLLVGGVPAAKASVASSPDSAPALYAQFRDLDGRTRDGQIVGGANQELVHSRGYYPYNRYRSPYYYRGYRGPGYNYGSPRYYRGPGYYPYRYGVPYYGGGWGYGRSGFYFGFGF